MHGDGESGNFQRFVTVVNEHLERAARGHTRGNLQLEFDRLGRRQVQHLGNGRGQRVGRRSNPDPDVSQGPPAPVPQFHNHPREAAFDRLALDNRGLQADAGRKQFD